MNLPFILAAVLVPVTIGGIIFFLIFRRVNRKYVAMFTRLAEIARSDPDKLRPLLGGSAEENEGMVNILSGINRITRVEIARAGKSVTSLYVHAFPISDQSMTGKPDIYDVLLQLDGQWSIRRFAPL